MTWQRVLRRPGRLMSKDCCEHVRCRRGLATPASGTFQYETGNANGVKIASRDLPGPTATLGLVAKAGTRYQILPGFSEGLENFAFKVCIRSFHQVGGQTSNDSRKILC